MCYDCIVVGKGAIGLSIIFHLLQKGVKVLCIDDSPRYIDAMASFASGAMLGAISELSHLNLLGDMEEEAFIEARKYHLQFQKSISEKSGSSYEIKDGLFVIAGGYGGEQDFAELNHQIEICKKYNIKFDHVLPSEIPGFKPTTYTGIEKSVFFNFDGTINSGEFMACIDYSISTFSKQKYSFIQDNILQIEKTENTYFVKCNSGNYLCTNHIIFSTGAFYHNIQDTILSNNEKKIVLYSGRGVGLHLSKIKGLTNGIRTPNRDFACGLHLLPNDSTTYLGATNRFTPSPNEIEKHPYVNEHQFLINSSIQELNSNILQSSHLKSVVGYRPLSIDRRPIVGRLNDGLWIANGTYRNGMLLAPLIGMEISNAIFENIEPRKYWNTNRKLMSEFRNPEFLTNESWVANVKSEMVHHVSKRKDIFNTTLGNERQKAEEFCDFVYKEVFCSDNNELSNKHFQEAYKLFQDAPIRENVPRVLNFLLSEYNWK